MPGRGMTAKNKEQFGLIGSGNTLFLPIARQAGIEAAGPPMLIWARIRGTCTF